MGGLGQRPYPPGCAPVVPKSHWSVVRVCQVLGFCQGLAQDTHLQRHCRHPLSDKF